MKFHTFLYWIGCLALALIGVQIFGQPDASAADIMTLPLIGGLIVNAQVMTAVFTNLKTTFNKAFAAAPSFWQKVAMKVPSTGAQNDYKWIANFPRMRKWVGEKVVKSLAAFGYTVTNDDFEATVEVDRNDVEDDNLGIYGPQAQAAGYSSAQLPDEIVADLINNSFTALCYDGQYMVDVDHPVMDKNGIVQSVSNKGTKQLNCSTQAAAIASLGVGRTAMKKFTDDEGRPLNCIPNILLVPPALEDIANVLANNDKLNDGQPNPYKGTITVVCDARLTSDTAWFLIDGTKPIMPFIYQERKAPVFVQQTNTDSEEVFMRKKFRFGAEARAAGGYGLWQLVWGSDGTVA